MDGSGASKRWSISDEIAAKINYSTTMRALCMAWLYPAVSLIWAGLGTLGLRSMSEAGIRATLERAQAVAVLLAIFTVLVGCIWAVRTWPYLPTSGFSRIKRRWNGPLAHAAAVPAGGAAALACLATDGPVLPLILIAGAAGCFAGMIIPRWLRQAPLPQAKFLTAFSAALVAQVTLGWAPVLNPGGGLNALIVVTNGLVLAWAAIVGARAVTVQETGRPLTAASVGLPVGSLSTATKAAGSDELLAEAAAGSRATPTVAAAQDTESDRVSQAPALPSLREPAVGH